MQLIPLTKIRSRKPSYLVGAIPKHLVPHIFICKTTPVRSATIKKGYNEFGQGCYHRYPFSYEDYGLGYLAGFFQQPLMSFDRDLTETLQHHFGYRLVDPFNLGDFPESGNIWLDCNILVELSSPQTTNIGRKLAKGAQSPRNLNYIIPDFIARELIRVTKKITKIKKAKPARKSGHKKSKQTSRTCSRKSRCRQSKYTPQIHTPRSGPNQDWSIATRYRALAKSLLLA